MASVAQQGSLSSFIEPERSTTKAMSRGEAMATAEAEILYERTLKILAKHSGTSPLCASSR